MALSLVLASPNCADSTTTVTFTDISGPSRTITVEKAVTSTEKAKGLMYRDSLKENHGMLFFFSTDSNLSFWMKNVTFSIDILFLDSDFVIGKIHHNAPPCVNDPCPLYSSGFKARYALEVIGGFCEKYGVTEGQKVEYNQ